MSQRRIRVEHGLRDVLSDLISNHVRDPRVRKATMITVAKVECNVDMSVAKVYVSIIGEDADIDGALEGLKASAGFLRGPVGRELNLMHAPELRFFVDQTIDVSAKLAAILRDDEERARAVGRIAGQAEPGPAIVATPEPELAPASQPAPAAPDPAAAASVHAEGKPS